MRRNEIRLLRFIRDIFHCDRTVKQIKIYNEGMDLCFLNCASSIVDNPGISQDKLACMLMLNKSTITRNLSYLEEHGYVKREQCAQDKRITEVYPTEKMMEVLPAVEKKLDEWYDDLLIGFSDEEKELYFKMTQKVLENSNAYVNKVRVCKKDKG